MKMIWSVYSERTWAAHIVGPYYDSIVSSCPRMLREMSRKVSEVDEGKGEESLPKEHHK